MKNLLVFSAKYVIFQIKATKIEGNSQKLSEIGSFSSVRSPLRSFEKRANPVVLGMKIGCFSGFWLFFDHFSTFSTIFRLFRSFFRIFFSKSDKSVF